jgi:hypothetical protein
MAVSRGFKRAMKFRTRRSRRTEVVFFVFIVTFGLYSATCRFEWGLLNLYLYPLARIAKSGMMSWDERRRVIPVSTLDDLAMLEHGVGFEALGKTQQSVILDRYRGGTWLLNYFPDEREHDMQATAHLRAYELMRWLLPAMSLLCWAMYRWVEDTNVLVLLFWIVIVVLALPQMILLWTEPEDVREMQVVGGVEA